MTEISIEVMRELFNQYNKDKFNSKLPLYTIEFRKMRCKGNIIFSKKIIKLNPIYDYNSMCNTLLHELAHAEIHRRGNRAKGHTLKFWRLFKSVGGIISDTNKALFKKASEVN